MTTLTLDQLPEPARDALRGEAPRPQPSRFEDLARRLRGQVTLARLMDRPGCARVLAGYAAIAQDLATIDDVEDLAA